MSESHRPAPPRENAGPPAGRSQLRHELRTPLHQIIGYSQLVKEQLSEEGHPELVEDLDKIERASRRLLSLVERMVGPVPTGLTAGPKPSAAAPRALSPPVAPGPGHLLVVDDNEMNRDMLARRLQQRGYSVESAASGPEALERIAASSFDVVLLDVMMPGMSGLEVLEEVRKTRSRAEFPVIMATARDASEDIVEALTRGANDYVTKPIDFGVVLARVETQISLKRARDQVDGLNRNLLAAQERIARLEASSDEAVRDVAAWSGTMAEDVAVTLGAAALGVFAFDNGEIEPLFSDGLPSPSASVLVDVARRRDPVLKGDEWVVPVVGLSGDLVGGLVVAGKREGLSTEERRLLQSFAHQLGGALELSRVRYELSAARERAQETRQEMLKKGIDLLQVCPACGACYDQTTTVCAADGRTLSSRRLIPYRVADRYRLVRVLGEGGMGTVFRAYDVKLDRDVAIKILKPEHFDDPSLRLRFENEARAAARIDHPGVVAVYDSGQLGDGSLFLVMELLEGSDLATVLERSGRGRPREVAELLRQGAAALAAAHRANLIHRDVKPENIFLVDRPGGFQVKIVDFGVAKQMNADLHLTKTGLIVGTPAYMSPEQLEGKEVDARSDVYSLAAVAYEALSGRRVTLEEDLAQIFVDVLQREPPRLSTLVLGIPAEVDQAFAIALAKSPVLRPWDAEQWVASFAQFLERAPSDAIGWLDGGSAAEGTPPAAHFRTQQMPERGAG